MFLWIAALVIGIWVLMTGWKFYRRIDWNEPAEVGGPDKQAMRKREAELMHIQEVLAAARDAGKLSANVVDEFDRYCESEIQSFRAAETAWRNRRASRRPPQS